MDVGFPVRRGAAELRGRQVECELLYRLVENWVAGDTASAFRHSNEIISLERSLHVFVEPKLQAWAAGSHLLLVVATYVYLNAQTTLLVGALVYLYVVHNRNYYFVRNMLLVAMVLALLCYTLYPAAPPRFVRARLYRYRFSTAAERGKSGAWWQRELVGLWFPAVSLDTPGFRQILVDQGWMSPAP